MTIRRCGRTGKARYRSQDAAITAAATQASRLGPLGHRPLGVYACPACGDWHVGHRPIVLPAAVQHGQAPIPASAPLRCGCHCRKAAETLVRTPRGQDLPVCARHAALLRKRYDTAEGRDGLR